MRFLGPLLLVAVVVAVVYWVTHRPERADAPLAVFTARVRSPIGELQDELARWVDAGLISEEQSEAILEHERVVPPTPMTEPTAHWIPPPTRAPETPGRRVPVVAEALGYLGGVLATVGLVLLVASYWPDLALPARLGMSAAVAAGLVAGGAFVPERIDPALARLRWSLWLAATAPTVVFFAVLARDGWDGHVKTVVLVASAAAAVLNGALWAWRVRPLQQALALASLVVFAGSAAGEFAGDGPVGLAVWTIGAVYVAAGLRGWTPLPHLTEAEGGLALIVGAVFVSQPWPPAGMLLLVATAFALLAVATVPRLAPERGHRVVLTVAGVLALLQGGPGTLGFFSQEAGVATGLVTWLLGAVLVVVGTRELVRTPLAAQVLGGAAIVGGAALTGTQAQGFATVFGFITAVGLVGVGMLPGRVLMSVFGSVGLLINVPWGINWFFPGEGRAPLLILVAGAVILVVAVLLTRMGGRFREELGGPRDGPPPSPRLRTTPFVLTPEARGRSKRAGSRG